MYVAGYHCHDLEVLYLPFFQCVFPASLNVAAARYGLVDVEEQELRLEEHSKRKIGPCVALTAVHHQG